MYIMKTHLILASLLLLMTSAAEASEKRCGWFVNPTPANAWLLDRFGEWLISVQGGFQAEGDWPNFSDAQWVKTNVSYGYGCACLDVEVDHASKKITKILKSEPKPLSTCRKDKTLPKPQ